MNFENYPSRITSLTNFNTFEKLPADYKELSRQAAFQEEMQKKTCIKTKYSQFNDKHFYFSDGIISLSLSHSYLEELAKFKRRDEK